MKCKRACTTQMANAAMRAGEEVPSAAYDSWRRAASRAPAWSLSMPFMFSYFPAGSHLPKQSSYLGDFHSDSGLLTESGGHDSPRTPPPASSSHLGSEDFRSSHGLTITKKRQMKHRQCISDLGVFEHCEEVCKVQSPAADPSWFLHWPFSQPVPGHSTSWSPVCESLHAWPCLLPPDRRPLSCLPPGLGQPLPFTVPFPAGPQ